MKRLKEFFLMDDGNMISRLTRTREALNLYGQHLSLLAHLSFLLSQETFRAALENRLSNQDLLDIINHIESTRGA